MLTGHASHQIGLDADIWMLPARRLDLSVKDRENISSISLRRANGAYTNDDWTPQHHEILKAAASDPRVARIFVNWVIKAQLCRERQRATGEAAAESEWGWLRKIRPWYGHDQHFHVRLSCPAGSDDCRNQGTLPPGDSCGKERWFSRASVRRRRAATARAAEERAAARAAMSPQELRRARAADRRKAEAKAAAERRRTEPINRRCAALTDPSSAGETR